MNARRLRPGTATDSLLIRQGAFCNRKDGDNGAFDTIGTKRGIKMSEQMNQKQEDSSSAFSGYGYQRNISPTILGNHIFKLSGLKGMEIKSTAASFLE